ncbi:DUF6150 family protein [Herbaspirillum rubrisubalbicans]|uniref:7(1) septoil knot domain-containing protein n=1 Tax=Herbaspirillum rubrisubalbicans TaxID=80842 RepID=A0AAD0XHI8_9BURK|nr:DUF6150 family protein [Herbaspirillum rubrisubalbicans]AYR24590.1 hypothetical protein RC54_12500 [Herbaspirillum rubrisubalbicans]
MARIYQTTSMGDATLRVALVADLGMADLLVYRVADQGSAQGDGFWYITKDRHEATSRLVFTSIGMAQVKVHFVDDWGRAGWQNGSRQALRYHGKF